MGSRSRARRRRGPVALLVGLLLVGLLLAGTTSCGVPTGGQPTSIPASEVPYDLALPTSSSADPPTAVAVGDRPQVYFVAPDDSLVPRGRDLSGKSVRAQLIDLLASLASGPTAQERAQGLSSSLDPAVELRVTADEGGRFTIDVGGVADAPSGRGSRRAVGQIVLSATSLPGVSSIVLTRGGSTIDAPLPAGELTGEPLTSQEYSSLTAPPSSPGR